MNIHFENYQLKIYTLLVKIERTIREELYNPDRNEFDNSIFFEYEVPFGIYAEKDIAEKAFNETCIYDLFSQLETPDIYCADLILYEVTMTLYEEADYTEIKRKDLTQTIE